MRYDVVIAGGGLGGLECAYILAKHGMGVCVVEKERRVGGCLQMFKRGGMEFDTGFHYVGSMGEGEPLRRIFDYFNLSDTLPWVRMDEGGFDEVVIGGEHYMFANGYERFAETLGERFPKERGNVERYAEMLRAVGEGIERSFDAREAEDVYGRSLFARSAYEYLHETFGDERLIEVLSGTSLKMELDAERLPLYVFAQINSSFVRSAWRLRGGGQQLADHIAADIRAMGGVVLTGRGVTGVTEDAEGLTGVVLEDGERIEGDWFVSGVHPAVTMGWLSESRLVRRVYRNRLAGLRNTFGMFTVNCRLKPNTVRYRNRNIYVYGTGDVWNVGKRVWDGVPQGVMVSFPPPRDGGEWAECVDILMPMRCEDAAVWAGGVPMHRSAEYEEMKEVTARRCIEMAAREVPELETGIERYYTSTPLTYEHYTGAPGGTAYGVAKDWRGLMYTLLTPRTPVRNLLLTGQSLNLHGVLGVSMTSFFTCQEILGPVSPFEFNKNIIR